MYTWPEALDAAGLGCQEGIGTAGPTSATSKAVVRGLLEANEPVRYRHR